MAEPVATLPLASYALGSDAVMWRTAGDVRTMLLAVRALALQVAHPMVGAGVAEHSVYKTDPWGRLYRSIRSLNVQVYGAQSAVAEGERLARLHRSIRGVDAHGRRYSALNPEAFWWVHATVFESFVVFHRHFDTPLSAAEQARLYQEWRSVGRMLGILERDLPESQDEFWRRFADISSRLELNEVVADVLHNGPTRAPWMPVTQRVLDAANRPLMRVQRDIAAVTLPADLRTVSDSPIRPGPTHCECRFSARSRA